MPVGTAVFLVVAKASEEMVNVPDVVGSCIPMAEHVLAEAGLKLGEVKHEVSGDKPWTVIGQHPVAGTSVPIGSAVDLVVAVGAVNIGKAANMVSLSWQAFGDGQYTVQWMDDHGVWHDVPGTSWPIPDTNWTGEDITDIGRRFYRVISH